MCGPIGWAVMMRIIANTHDVLRKLTSKQKLPNDEVWHLWTVIIPRRTITGRLVRGPVLRRRDDGRWIYKKYFEPIYPTDGRALIGDCIDKSSQRGRRST